MLHEHGDAHSQFLTKRKPIRCAAKSTSNSAASACESASRRSASACDCRRRPTRARRRHEPIAAGRFHPAIDDQPTAGMNMSDVLALVRGEPAPPCDFQSIDSVGAAAANGRAGAQSHQHRIRSWAIGEIKTAVGNSDWRTIRELHTFASPRLAIAPRPSLRNVMQKLTQRGRPGNRARFARQSGRIARRGGGRLRNAAARGKDDRRNARPRAGFATSLRQHERWPLSWICRSR